MAEFKTADLCDMHGEVLQVAEPSLLSFGGLRAFHGVVRTVRCFEDNSLVQAALKASGDGAVLVVDGGGSLRCALLGDQLAALAEKNSWSGVIVYGCVRDAAALANTSIGVRAIATHPRKSVKRGAGQRDIPVGFAGVTFTPGDYVYVDEDGIAILSTPLD